MKLFFVSLLVTSRVSRADTKQQQRGVLSSLFYAGFICNLRTRGVAVEITNKCGILKLFVSALKCSHGVEFILKLLKIMLLLKLFPCCCKSIAPYVWCRFVRVTIKRNSMHIVEMKWLMIVVMHYALSLSINTHTMALAKYYNSGVPTTVN